MAAAAIAASDAVALVAPCARFAWRTQGLLDVVAGSGVAPVANGGGRASLSVTVPAYNPALCDTTTATPATDATEGGDSAEKEPYVLCPVDDPAFAADMVVPTDGSPTTATATCGLTLTADSDMCGQVAPARPTAGTRTLTLQTLARTIPQPPRSPPSRPPSRLTPPPLPPPNRPTAMTRPTAHAFCAGAAMAAAITVAARPTSLR